MPSSRPGTHPVTITIDAEHPRPVVPDDFAGLSFEQGPGNTGVSSNLFTPANNSLITLFRNLGLGNLRIGGGTVDKEIPAGTGGDFTGIDNLFAFAAVAGVKVIYTVRLLNPAANPIGDLEKINRDAAEYIWRRYQENVASFAIGNEPDWPSYHGHETNPLDPAIFEVTEKPGSVYPGSAYPSYHTHWRSFADAIRDAAPGAPLSGPDTGAYKNRKTYTPNPNSGVSWTERRVKPVQIQNPDRINLTAYCVGGAGEDYLTIINKAHGASARDAAVTIVAPGPGLQDAEIMTLAGALYPLHGVTRAAQPLPEAQRARELPAELQDETPAELHRHFHGVSAEDVAAILRNQDQP